MKALKIEIIKNGYLALTGMLSTELITAASGVTLPMEGRECGLAVDTLGAGRRGVDMVPAIFVACEILTF